MDVKKEKLSWIENVTVKTTQLEADMDVIVPDVKPDIKKILQIDADVEAKNCEVQNERVILNGNVHFNVIYLPDNADMLQSIRVTVPFTDVVSISGVEPKMECNYSADVLSVSYKIINGRKFSVKSIIEAVLDIKKPVNFESLSEIDDSEIQVKKTGFNLMLRSGRCNKNILMNEKIIIPDSEPSIGEILNVNAKVNEYSIKVINNKVIVKGDVKIACTYVEAGNGTIATINHVAPFTEIFDVDGVNSDDYSNIILETAACEFGCEENASGEIRSIEVSSFIKANISAYRNVECNFIKDCYCTTKQIKIDTAKVKLPQNMSVVNFNDTLKSNLTIADSEPSVERVYDAFSKAYIENVSSEDNRLIVNGVVDSYVLYITKDKENPVFCTKSELAFSQSFDCAGCLAPQGEINAEVLKTSYTINSDDSIDLSVNFKLTGMTYSFEELEVITGVNKTDNEVSRETASIIVYFAQDNDTLWDIAKKYSSTVDDIIEINELGEDADLKDMRLLIPRYKKIL